MHKILSEALPRAEGRSEFIIAVIADVRGFSAFSLGHESPEIAMYIKRVYLKLIEEYFSFASFYKSTGDGLLITVRFDEGNLAEQARATISTCLRCLEEFAEICSGDSMINFEVPSRLGFGVTRGTACCLVSGDTVLDYSGQILNLASRLTDLARPQGVVLDGQFGIELLPPEIQDRFERSDVYIRTVAEEDPRSVYVLKEVVDVPAQAKTPLAFEQWMSLEEIRTLAEWRDRSPEWVVFLPSRLKRPDGVRVRSRLPIFKSGKEVRDISYEEDVVARYEPIGDKPRLVVDVGEIVATARRRRLPLRAVIALHVHFVARDG